VIDVERRSRCRSPRRFAERNEALFTAERGEIDLREAQGASAHREVASAIMVSVFEPGPRPRFAVIARIAHLDLARQTGSMLGTSARMLPTIWRRDVED
jgi:hypothetical protein